MSEQIKILIAEDHSMTRLGLELAVRGAENLTLVASCENGKQAVLEASARQPDIVLMDISMPELNGIEATKKIKAQNSEIRVLMFTSHDDKEKVFAALCAGADGYMTKDIATTKLIPAIEAVASGVAWLDSAIAKIVLQAATEKPEKTEDNKLLKTLTARELEVLKLIAQGLSNIEIAETLTVTKATAKTHVHSILQKLCIYNRSQATAIAIKHGLA